MEHFSWHNWLAASSFSFFSFLLVSYACTQWSLNLPTSPSTLLQREKVSFGLKFIGNWLHYLVCNTCIVKQYLVKISYSLKHIRHENALILSVRICICCTLHTINDVTSYLIVKTKFTWFDLRHAYYSGNLFFCFFCFLTCNGKSLVY